MRLESNIPIPPQEPRSKSPFSFALEMEVGHSFSLNTTKGRDAALRLLRGQYSGRKYASRKMSDGTFRIWRTA